MHHLRLNVAIDTITMTNINIAATSNKKLLSSSDMCLNAINENGNAKSSNIASNMRSAIIMADAFPGEIPSRINMITRMGSPPAFEGVTAAISRLAVMISVDFVILKC